MAIIPAWDWEFADYLSRSRTCPENKSSFILLLEVVLIRFFRTLFKILCNINSLPNHVVSAETVNTFKQRLDKFWIDQDVMYNYKADFHGNNNNVVL